MEIVALIPARGGSKSISRKNLQSLLGLPLVAHTIKTALSCELVTRTIVSTDDLEIADIARYYGAEVPFLRPENISLDHVRDAPVIEHLIKWFETNEGHRPEVIVFLRPTNPQRSTNFINLEIQRFITNDISCMARSVRPAIETPYKMWTILNGVEMRPFTGDIKDDYFNYPRQLLPEVFWQDGYLDLIRPCYFLDSCDAHELKISAIKSPTVQNFDIDYVEDFKKLENNELARSITQIDMKRYGS